MDADGATDLTPSTRPGAGWRSGADVAIGSRGPTDRSPTPGTAGSASAAPAPTAPARQHGARRRRHPVRLQAHRAATSPAASSPDLQTVGFSFDVEMLARAQAHGARIAEFPVVWTDIPGSTFVPARHGARPSATSPQIAWLMPRERRTAGRRPPRPAGARGRCRPPWRWRPDMTSAPLHLASRRSCRQLARPRTRLAGGSERYAWEFALALREAGAAVDFVTARDPGQSAPRGRTGSTSGARAARSRSTPTLAGAAHPAAPARRRHRRRVRHPVVRAALRTPRHRRGHGHAPRPPGPVRDLLPGPAGRIGRSSSASSCRASTGVPRPSRSPTRRGGEMRDQLGWEDPVGILANGSRPCRRRRGLRSRTRFRAASSCSAGWCRTSGSTWSSRRSHALRADPARPRLDIVGKGPEQGRLRTWPSGSVSPTGSPSTAAVEEAPRPRLLRRAALHVCASDVEGWGQVVIEAAGFGVPTIARDVPGLRDSIRDGRPAGWCPTRPTSRWSRCG